MILSTQGEVDAYKAGFEAGAKAGGRYSRMHLKYMIRGVQVLVRIGYNTLSTSMPWVKKSHGPTVNNPDVNIPPDAPHGFGIRQPIGEDPADAALDQS